jgi:signal transduction histidine kinase/ligand-binding sensor domain-containing protein
MIKACAPVLAGILLAVQPCAFALNPALDITQYAHKPWTINDGFFKGSVMAVAQTSDGYLWLGAEFGLLRFDGVRAVPWEPPSGEQLPSNNIRSLLVSGDGTLWIGTMKGLANWKDGKLTHFAEFAGRQVARLYEDHQGAVWVAGSDLKTARVCVFNKHLVDCYGDDGRLGSGVYSMYEYKGALWLGASNGLWRWKPAPPRLYPAPVPLATIGDLIQGDNGALWMTLNGRISQFVDEKILPLPAGAGFSAYHWLRDRDGALWIGTRQGLLHLHRGRTDVFTSAEGLSSDSIYKLFEDREGSIWAATLGGLDRFRDYPIPTVTFRQGLSGIFVSAVLAARNGSIWLGTNDGVDRWDDGQIAVYRNPADRERAHAGSDRQPGVHEINDNGLPDNKPAAIFEDDGGRIWVSTLRGFARFENGHFVPAGSMSTQYVHAIAEDNARSIWFGDQRSLFHWIGGKFAEPIPWEKLGFKDYPSALVSDPVQGGLWIGLYTDGGVAYYKDGNIRESYSAGSGLGAGHVHDLRLGGDRALWISTEGGLSRLKDGRIVTLSSKNGLPCDSVHWMQEDDLDSVWLLTECGLVRIPRTDLDAWSRDPKRTIRSTLFDASSGIRGRSGIYGHQPHVSKATDGKLWFTTPGGVIVIDPRHLPTNQLSPPVHIEQITADRQTWWKNLSGVAPSNLRLPPLTRDLVIDYTATSLVAPEKIRFRYKLEGRDRDWRDDTENHRQAVYSDLSPRPYRFRVKACNNSGVWNEAGAFVDFSIAPTLLQTRWFQALCLAAGLALFALLYHWRMRYLARQYEIRTATRVGERTRIARDLHDTLLQSFQGLLLKFHSVTYDLPSRPDAAQKTLESAIEQARQAITEGRDAIQGLRSCTIDSDLSQAITVLGEELNVHHNSDHPPEFRVQVEGAPRDLAPLLQDDVYRIAGEALRNAFRHAEARRIEVEIRYDERQLRLRIRDDGKGIDRKFLTSGGRAGHFGLPGMQERGKLLGGELAVWSEFDSGTEIELTVPASIAYARKKEPINP